VHAIDKKSTETSWSSANQLKLWYIPLLCIYFLVLWSLLWLKIPNILVYLFVNFFENTYYDYDRGTALGCPGNAFFGSSKSEAAIATSAVSRST